MHSPAYPQGSRGKPPLRVNNVMAWNVPLNMA